ncbi:DNA repair protein RadC [Thermincola ferriacetica]|uniref:DNA repair protein RadC n=2 Tax=Thermincola TaxID=278993 RepID=D5XBF5_THEPJ|nr:DNA repair protein RadC [Thermincola potens JR]KNZ69568.1 DNA repair protein RadC [Thermincola ferriacetica]
MGVTGYHVTIKEMPQELRPRERLLTEGPGSLSNAELIAILLGTGTRTCTAVQLASQLLSAFGGLKELVGASVEEISSIKGIGLAKATQVKAALELAGRLSLLAGEKKYTIRTPEDVAGILMEKMRHYDREHFLAIMLNTKNQVLNIETVSIGHLNASLVHPREIFKSAIKKSAAALIVAHNHPSGDPHPSKEDILITKRLVEVGEIIGIEVLDHVILGDNNFTSLKQEGLI